MLQLVVDSSNNELLSLIDATQVRNAVESNCTTRQAKACQTSGTSIVKKLKERAFSLPGKLPAPSILANFVLRFGSGSPLPLIIASFDGYLWTLAFVRVRRQKYWSLTRSGLTNRRPCTWPRTTAISSNVLCMSCFSTLKVFSPHCANRSSRELPCIKYQ